MKRPAVTKVIATTVVLLLVMVSAASAATRVYRARHALRFIARHQSDDGSITAFSTLGSTADGVLAMAAARRGRVRVNRALDYLRGHLADATSIGLEAKVVMAVVAGGRNPRRFGGKNLVRKIKRSQHTDGHYGAGASVIDHALAMLALLSAGVQPAAPAPRWLTDAQCPDGGWQFDAPYSPSSDGRHCHSRTISDFSRSDTNTTSYAVQALDALPTPAAPSASPFAYFRWVRDPIKHGWGYDQKSRLTDANSTALVLQAYAAAGRRHPRHAMRPLKKLQYTRCGGKHFRFSVAFTWKKTSSGNLKRTGPDLGATLGAVLGLLRQPLPVPSRDIARRVPRLRRCP